MSDEFIKDNEELLRKIRDGKIPNSHIKTAIGSFIMCIFEKDMMPNVIPLFFSFISSQTGKDYSEEVNLVEECYKSGMNDFENFVMIKLLGMAISDLA